MRKIWILFIPVLFLGFTSCKKECTCPNEPTKETLTLQPGAEGEDAIVAVRETDGGLNADANHNSLAEISMGTWTYDAHGWGVGTNRSYLKFTGLSDIPSGAVIKSAKLFLYGVSSSSAAPQGNSNYSGSPYNTYGENKTWLKRVTGDWSEGTITWNNKPNTTDANQVALPTSNEQWGFDVTNIDVTDLVKDMLSNGQNYGFCLQLQTEEHYRSITFASSEATDASKRPRLVVEYEEQ